MADARVLDFDPDFMRLGRRDFDVLDSQVLPRLPSNGSLSRDDGT